MNKFYKQNYNFYVTDVKFFAKILTTLTIILLQNMSKNPYDG
ncbi:hypothetical protein [Moraxella lacunata]